MRTTTRVARALRGIRAAIGGLVALGMCACGGSGSDTPHTSDSVNGSPTCAAATECGTLLIGLTDADGGIVSYTVDLLGLELERADGTIVQTLPATTRVDFAELTDLAELVGAATLPPGVFVGGTLTIDYSGAEIFVEVAGEIVPAEIVAADGAPLGVVELRVQLASDGRVAIRRGQVAFLSVDLDLALSHRIDASVVPPRIVAEPFVTAEIAPVTEKPMRVRGTLIAVDVASQSYTIRLRPWHRRVGDHGAITVHTNTATVFEIGGTRLTGTAGLEALAGVDAGSLTAAFGTLELADRTFTAAIVLARDSVDGNGIDTIAGNIVARDGDRLKVKGAWTSPRSDRPQFRGTVLVDVGPATQVLKATERDTSHASDALSVGQRIVAFGTFRDQTESANGLDALPVLDATEGRVRMHVTHLYGEVTELVAGRLTMRLRAIDRLSAGMYDFTGTGLPGYDADPSAYEVAIGSLPLDSLAVDAPVRVLGFVAPFGTAPPDFEGHTLVGHRDLRSTLSLSWLAPGTTAPFLSQGPEGLVPDLTNPQLGARHHLLVGDRSIDLLALPATPTIAPSEGRAWYGLYAAGRVEMFAAFPEFVTALTARLDGSSTARALAAYGRYDDSTSSLSARSLVVQMQAIE